MGHIYGLGCQVLPSETQGPSYLRPYFSPLLLHTYERQFFFKDPWWYTVKTNIRKLVNSQSSCYQPV